MDKFQVEVSGETDAGVHMEVRSALANGKPVWATLRNGEMMGVTAKKKLAAQWIEQVAAAVASYADIAADAARAHRTASRVAIQARWDFRRACRAAQTSFAV